MKFLSIFLVLVISIFSSSCISQNTKEESAGFDSNGNTESPNRVENQKLGITYKNNNNIVEKTQKKPRKRLIKRVLRKDPKSNQLSNQASTQLAKTTANRKIIYKKQKVNASNILNQNITLNSNGNTLGEIMAALLPGWHIKISPDLSNLILDVVVQTNRKEAIFDILRQVKAQVTFYEEVKPKPVAVIFAN
jgi:hypothetical protein